MKNFITKNLLLIFPILILLGTLLFCNYTINIYRNTAYKFVYNTNVESIKRFARELKELTTRGFGGEEYYHFYTNMIHVYNKTFGEKESLLTFLMDQNQNIYHSNTYNENHISPYLNSSENLALLSNTVEEHKKTKNSHGELKLQIPGNSEDFYYQVVSNGNEDYFIFMGIDKEKVTFELNANEIIIPICLIGLLLLLIIEYTIWLRRICPSHQKKNKGSDPNAD